MCVNVCSFTFRHIIFSMYEIIDKWNPICGIVNIKTITNSQDAPKVVSI